MVKVSKKLKQSILNTSLFDESLIQDIDKDLSKSPEFYDPCKNQGISEISEEICSKCTEHCAFRIMPVDERINQLADTINRANDILKAGNILNGDGTIKPDILDVQLEMTDRQIFLPSYDQSCVDSLMTSILEINKDMDALNQRTSDNFAKVPAYLDQFFSSYLIFIINALIDGLVKKNNKKDKAFAEIDTFLSGINEPVSIPSIKLVKAVKDLTIKYKKKFDGSAGGMIEYALLLSLSSIVESFQTYMNNLLIPFKSIKFIESSGVKLKSGNIDFYKAVKSAYESEPTEDQAKSGYFPVYYQNIGNAFTKFADEAEPYIGLFFTNKDKIANHYKQYKGNASPKNALNTLNQLIDYHDKYDIAYKEAYLKQKLDAVRYCGGKLNTVPAEVKQYEEDLNKKTFSKYATISEIDYWDKYAEMLTLLNLIPTYWTTGLYIPNPSGVIKIPLPTIWKALVAITMGSAIIVVFLTINGIAICPVVWGLAFPPVVSPLLGLSLPINFNIGMDLSLAIDLKIILRWIQLNLPKVDITMEMIAKMFHINPIMLPLMPNLSFLLDFAKNLSLKLPDIPKIDIPDLPKFKMPDLPEFKMPNGEFDPDILIAYIKAYLDKIGFRLDVDFLAKLGINIPEMIANINLNIPKIKLPGVNISLDLMGPPNPSYLLIMLKGSNQLIKSNTAVKPEGMFLYEMADIDPDITQYLPYLHDDVPIIERLSLMNFVYVRYLDMWLKTAKPYMGLP